MALFVRNYPTVLFSADIICISDFTVAVLTLQSSAPLSVSLQLGINQSIKSCIYKMPLKQKFSEAPLLSRFAQEAILKT